MPINSWKLLTPEIYSGDQSNMHKQEWCYFDFPPLQHRSVTVSVCSCLFLPHTSTSGTSSIFTYVRTTAVHCQSVPMLKQNSIRSSAVPSCCEVYLSPSTWFLCSLPRAFRNTYMKCFIWYSRRCVGIEYFPSMHICTKYHVILFALA